MTVTLKSPEVMNLTNIYNIITYDCKEESKGQRLKTEREGQGSDE